MKIVALASLVLLAPRAEIRFEREGVRVGDTLVQGSVLELRGSGAATFLASGRSIEALTATLEVEVAPGRSLLLEPGLLAAREVDGVRFLAHGDRKIRFEADGERVVLAGPVRMAVTAEGWQLGDARLGGAVLKVGLQAQDDTKENLDRMLRAKERMATAPGARPSPKMPRLFRGDPLSGGQAANSLSVRTLPHVSPSGAP